MKPNRASAQAETPSGEPVDPVELSVLLRKLSFSAEGVAEAALEGASLFEASARYRVAKMRLRSAAEMNLDRIRADRELFFRKEAAMEGEKITEGNIKAKLAVDDSVQKAQAAFNAAEADEEYARLLLEAYRIRRDSLKAIVDLTGAERAMSQIIENNQSRLAETRKKLAAKYPGQ